MVRTDEQIAIPTGVMHVSVKRVIRKGSSRHGAYYRVSEKGKRVRYYKVGGKAKVRTKQDALRRFEFFKLKAKPPTTKEEITAAEDEVIVHFRVDYKSPRGSNYNFGLDDSSISITVPHGWTDDEAITEARRAFEQSMVDKGFGNVVNGVGLPELDDKNIVTGMERTNYAKGTDKARIRYRSGRNEDYVVMDSSVQVDLPDYLLKRRRRK